ncbi:GNAT family N-acetyltransferase [Halobium salinum]|uniref:GNAT family N-acetyltransferase n=1 Tax=Halobium salinum TaxID=1364940 RepID=A0ABD5PGF7_9EURY|nr:GNAT family N-acetyltransferase [Halobium salinum]
MTDQPSVRPAEAEDGERIREVAESSMTSSYAMSPAEIEALVETEFGEDARRAAREDDDRFLLVAEVDDVLGGVVAGSLADGEVRWLHVDPERRGLGVGSALFEAARDELAEVDAEVKAVAVADNTSAGDFFERCGFGKREERTVTLGDRETVEYVFVEGASEEETGGDGSPTEDDGTPDSAPQTAGGMDESTGDDTEPTFPETTTVDGEELSLGDDHLQGTEAAFAPTYTDADREERFGFYCGNCGSTDVSADSMERLECENCGNVHKPDDDYDGSYL